MLRGYIRTVLSDPWRQVRKSVVRVCLTSFVLVGVSTAVVGVADQERTISLYNIHKKETLNIVYKRNGKYVPKAMKKINHIMRDWRRNESTKMDPKLIDLVWSIHSQLGSQKPVHIISGYRSKKTNERLRRKGGGQARNSRHIMGKAADIHFPDVSAKQIRNSALIRERGGVGYYPTSAIPFVHVDTTGVRHWPRLPRLELAALFPNGKTKHRPRRGGPITKKDHAKAMARLSKKEKRLIRIARGEIKPDIKPVVAPVQVAKASPPAPVISPSAVTTQRAAAKKDVQGLNQLAAAVSRAPLLDSKGVTSPKRKTVSPQTPLWQTAAASAVPSFVAPKNEPSQPQNLVPNAGRNVASESSLKIGDRWQNAVEPAVARPAPARPVVASRTPSAEAKPKVRLQRASYAVASADPLGALIELHAFQKPAGGLAKKPVAKLASYEPPRDISLDVDSGRYSDNSSDGWARAPEYDEEHDDALAYLPFSILPFLNEKLTSEHNPLSKLIPPEYKNIVALAASKSAFPLQYRQNLSWAQEQWRQRFETESVAGFKPGKKASLQKRSMQTAAVR